MNREISPRAFTAYAAHSCAAHWRSNQPMPLLTSVDKTCREVLFLVASECRPIMFEDVSETRVAGDVLIIQSENGAGDAVSADESHVTVNRKQHSWTGIVVC